MQRGRKARVHALNVTKVVLTTTNGLGIETELELLQLEETSTKTGRPRALTMGTARAAAGWPEEILDLATELIQAVERHLGQAVFEEIEEESDGNRTGPAGRTVDDDAAPRLFVTELGDKAPEVVPVRPADGTGHQAR
jgi:hypothetical protein